MNATVTRKDFAFCK